MQLKYRGVQYEKTPSTLRMRPTGRILRYRNHFYEQVEPVLRPVCASNIHLRYRGVSYNPLMFVPDAGEPSVNTPLGEHRLPVLAR